MTAWTDIEQPIDTSGWKAGSVAERFIIPPFSILNTMSGDWQDRKRFWLSMGIQSELGRGDIDPGAQRIDPGDGGLTATMAGVPRTKNGRGKARAFQQDGLMGEYAMASRRQADAGTNLTGAALLPDYATSMGMERVAPGTSIFDPVLCELAYRWWSPPGGRVLDPFAGGSVRGIVAGYLGHPYVGVDLRPEQVHANAEQAATILPREMPGAPAPTWVVGDSRLVVPSMAGEFDMVFTCPPYFDLEVYSDDPSDLSNADTYADFVVAYRAIIEASVGLLAPGRFAVIVVSEVRDRKHPDGAYLGLVPDTIEAFESAGARFYNEAILVNSAGTLPLRVTKQFEASRKVGRMHQNVLVFLKGRVARGWDYSRPAPPDPQQALWDDREQPAAAPPAPIAADVPDVAPGPPDVALGDADGGQVTPPALRDTFGLPPIDDDDDDQALVTIDGYLADPDTGEVVVAPDPPPPPPHRGQARPGSGDWRCTGCSATPSGPLRETTLATIRRGLCETCGREKPYIEVGR